MEDTDTTIAIVPLKTINETLERFRRQQEQVARAQETVENDLQDKRERLKIVEMELELNDKKESPEQLQLVAAIKPLESTLQNFKNGCSVIEKAIGQLTSYKSAVERIDRGLAKSIFTLK